MRLACTSWSRAVRHRWALGFRISVLFALSAGSAAAEVERLGPTGSDGRRLGHAYGLTGEIRPGDTERLARLFDADAANPRSAVSVLRPARGVLGALDLQLDSPGGDIEEAIRLGRWLRATRGMATVEEGALCASACVLVLAGAVNRITPGTVVVHRHFFDSIEPLQAARAWQSTQESIRSYLREMNVPGGLLDLALEAPPEGGRPLTLEEKRRFLLSGWDPAAEEERIATLAGLYGITSGQFRRRWSETQAVCGAEGLVERRAFTLGLNPANRSRAAALLSDWNDCRWKAMGELPR